MGNRDNARASGPTSVPPRRSRRSALAIGAAGVAALMTPGLRGAAQSDGASPVPASGIGAFPPETQLALEAIVRDRLAQTDTPAALVGVWHPGRGEWTRAAGVGDLATAAPPAIDDHVRIASITKTFTATAVLLLVEDGKLNLDDRLDQYIAGIPNCDQITLRQVLNMTAGIASYVTTPIIAVDYVRDPLLPFTPQQALDLIRTLPPDFPPGAQARYSDSNYILLGFVIERVTGRPAAEVIADRVIRPLGLTETTFPTTPDMPAPYLHGYMAERTGDPLRDVTRSNPDVAWTAGAMFSTLADLRVWAKALADGALLSPAMQRERLTWNRIPSPNFEIGYGLGVLEINGLIGHNGGIFGYSSWMLHAPEEDATLVVVTNRAATEGGTADPIFYGIARLLFPDRFPPIEATLRATPAGATPAP